MLIIEFWSIKDSDDIRFADGYKQKMYINAELDKPEYPVILEGEENGDKEINFTFQKWEKRYRFQFVGFEFEADILTKLSLYDFATLTLPDSTIKNMLDIEVATEWIENSLYVMIEIKFSDEQLIKRITDSNLVLN